MDNTKISQSPLLSYIFIDYCYCSNFQLFEEREQFVHSQRFITKLKNFLGEEWKAYSFRSVYILVQDELTYLSSEFVFDTLLEAWVEYVKNQFKVRQDDENLIKNFESIVRIKLNDYLIDEIYFKPVMTGFYFSAGQVWTKINSTEMEEEDKTSSSTPDNYNQIRPLAIVNEQLVKYFKGTKKICRNDNQSQELQQQMENLSIEDELEEQNNSLYGISLNKFKKLTKAGSKLFNNYISSKYQVAQSFVMSIYEVKQINQNQLSSVANSARVRLLQPAQGFYNDLMEAWILFKTQNPSEKSDFGEYLQKVKSLQGERWNDRYIGPTQFFFQTLIQEWKQINSKQSCCFEDEEQKTRQLCQNVREQLYHYWEKEIVEKTSKLYKQMKQRN